MEAQTRLQARSSWLKRSLLKVDSLLPEKDREFILRVIAQSEQRHVARLRQVEEVLGAQIEALSFAITENRAARRLDVRKVAFSTGTVVSLVATVIGYLVENWRSFL